METNYKNIYYKINTLLITKNIENKKTHDKILLNK